MTDKERRTFTLDPENDRYCEELDNASAKVNKVITQLRQGSDSGTVAIDMQLRQKRRELTEAKNTVDRLESDIEELERVKDELTTQESKEISDAREALEDTPKKTTNPAIKKWANDLSMTPERLVERLQQHK